MVLIDRDHNPTTAVIMCGAPIHGRMLIEAMASNGHPLDLIISEQNTDRAFKIESFLVDNSFDTARPLPELLEMMDATYCPVDNFPSPKVLGALTDLNPENIVCGGCGIIGEPLLSAARYGLLNAHPGLLPAFRGLDPVLWGVAIRAAVGSTLHFVIAGIDEGGILLAQGLPWRGARKLEECRLQCMRLGGTLLSKFLAAPEGFPAQQQDNATANYYSAFPKTEYAATEEKLRHYIFDSEQGSRFQCEASC